MELSERERADLANFFAKRFPSFEERAALCEAVGLAARVQLTGEAHAVWADIVRVAAEESRLVALAERALKRIPEDDNLVEMVRLLREGRGPRRPWLWFGAGGLGIAAAVGLLLWAPWSGAPPAPASPPEPAPAPALALADPDPDLRSPSPIPIPDPDPDPDPDLRSPSPIPIPIPIPDPDPDPDPDLRSPSPIPIPAAASAPGCNGEPGVVIGYWYAGSESPGAQGDTTTIAGGVNVRAELPSRENGWNARSALVCSMGDGWRVRLGHAPVFVPGGAWWVPLAANDILER